MKLRVKDIVSSGQGFGRSPLLVAGAVALVTLFAWSLARAAVRLDRLVTAPRAQSVNIADDFLSKPPVDGTTEREAALFQAPPDMAKTRYTSRRLDTSYRDQGRLRSTE